MSLHTKRSDGPTGADSGNSSRYRTTYFNHIIGGYAAGYYSYLWANVLDNDAFEAFKEHGIFDKQTADLFRQNVLEKETAKTR